MGRLIDDLDKRFGFNMSAGSHVATRRPETGKEVNMSKPTVKRGELRHRVESLLLSQPERKFHSVSVQALIDHPNYGSVQSCLSDLHRDESSAVERVGPATYSVGTDLVEQVVERVEPAVGDLLEVIYRKGDRYLVLDHEDNLLAIKATKIGRL